MFLDKYIPFYKRNLSLAIPVMITQAGQMIVQLVDNYMVSGLGTTAFAGVGFANMIITIGIIFATCFTQGVIPYAGKNWGMGLHKKVSLYFQNALVLDVVFAALLPIIMFAIMPLMHYMGQDSDIIPYSLSYYKPIIISFIPYILFFAIRNFSEGIGITKYAMYITLGCNIVNIFFNWLLIHGNWGFEAMGVEGAAVATLISRILMLSAFIIILLSVNPYKRYLKFFKTSLIKRSVIIELIKTSAPIGMQGLAEVTAFCLSGIIIGFFGKQALAAQQIVFGIDTFIFMLAQGISVAATIRVSHQYGEKKYSDANIASNAAMHLALLIMGGLGVIVVLARTGIADIFSDDIEVIKIASILFLYSFTFKLFDASQLIGAAVLRAIGDVKIPLYIALLSYYVVCIPLGYVCAHIFNLGPQGVYIGLTVGLIMSSILYVKRFKKLITKLINSSNK